MPILFLDGFDDRTSVMNGPIKWTRCGTEVAAWAIVAGGRTGNRLQMGYSNGASWLEKDFSNIPTFYFGAALAAGGAAAGCTVLQFKDGSTVNLSVTINANRTLSVYRGTSGGTLLATTVDALSGTFAYVEVSATIHNTAGALTLKMNGVTLINLTGINTRSGSNNWINRLWLGQDWTPTIYIDDLYFADDQFYGGLKILTLLPTSDGATNQWARTGGSASGNYTAVNEPQPDDNTSYVSSASVGDLDLYNFADLPDPSVTVKGVQVWTRHERDDAVTRKAKVVVRSGGTNYPQGEFTTAQNVWQDDVQLLATDPATGTAWTGANVNAAQFGVQVTV